MRDPLIDPEFESLIPPVSAHEKALLTEKIKNEQMRQPIITWRNLVLDGHTRLAICKEHRWPFECQEMHFTSREEAMAWMLKNQLGRRNLQESQRAMLAARLANLSPGRPTKEAKQLYPAGTITQTLADQQDVSRLSVQRAKNVVRNGDESLQRAVTTGEIRVKPAEKISTLPKEEQRVIVSQGPKAVRAAARAIEQKKPVKVTPELPDCTPFDEAASLLKQLMGIVNHLCGAAAPFGGAVIMAQRAELEGHITELRGLFKAGRPHAKCEACAGKEAEPCSICNGRRWVTAEPVKPAPKKKAVAADPLILPEDLDSIVMRAAWTDWLKFRKEKGKPIKPTQAEYQFRHFRKIGEQEAVKQIERSIQNGWQGLFPANDASDVAPPAVMPVRHNPFSQKVVA